MAVYGQVCRQLEDLTRAVHAKAPLLADALRLVDGLEQQAAALPVPPWPEIVVGRACSEPPALWHARCLRTLLAGAVDRDHVDCATRARLLYHLRWLCSLFGSSDEMCVPRVSVVIPVYNRARLIGPTIESCLSQTAASVEVVITDDGSTDDLDAALAPYAGRIVLIRQENRGISHARRAAIDAATGDFVHLLDSDDFLLPECVADKLAAFAAVPDAELCYSGVVGFDPELIRRALISYENPRADPLCPTTSLLRSIAHRLPFLPSTVMMPRWILLEMNAFHEGLRRGEDIRLWFSLSTRRPKVIGLIGESVVRRYLPGSLGQLNDEPSCSHAIAIIMCLCDLVTGPALWPSAFQYLHALATINVWQEANAGEAPALAAWRSELLAGVASLGNGKLVRGHSPMPLIVLLLAGLRSLRDELGITDQPEFSFHNALEAALGDAAGSAAPLADEDVASWMVPEHVGIFDASAAKVLVALAGEIDADRERRRLAPAFQLLLHLADPTFDPEHFGPKTLATLSVNRVYARPAVRPERPGTVARIRASVTDRIPFGRVRRSQAAALELLDLFIAGGPRAAWRASIRDLREWRHLERLLAGGGRQSVHLETLREIAFGHEDAVPEYPPAQQARARFHAKPLARALGSEERRHQVTVAIVVSAVGAGNGLPATIDSGLARPGDGVEIVVSGDENDPAFAACAARYGPEVRFVGRARPDRASAFNIGMAHTFADFVVLAEAGDIIDTDAIAACLAAFDEEPRAEFALCPTVASPSASDGELMADIAAGCRLDVGEWMAPRWFILDTGPIDRWLGAHAFERYHFRFAAKAPVTVPVARRFVARWGAIPNEPPDAPLLKAAVEMLNLADLLAGPPHWRHCFALARRMNPRVDSEAAPRREAIVHALADERLDETIERLGDGAYRDGLSPLVAIAATLSGLVGTRGDISGRRQRILLRVAGSAAPVTDRDRGHLILKGLAPADADELLLALGRLESFGSDIPSRLGDAIALVRDVMENGSAVSRTRQEASAPRSR